MSNALTHKVCTSCNCTKPLDAFHIDKRREAGRKGICAECYRIRSLGYCAIYRTERRKEINEAQRTRRARLREEQRDLNTMPLFETPGPCGEKPRAGRIDREIPLLASLPKGVVR